MESLQQTHSISQRRACECLGVSRSTVRYSSVKPDLDASVIEHLAGLRARHRDWGYRKLTRLLQNEGFGVNHKRIYRVYRQEHLQIPHRRKRRRSKERGRQPMPATALNQRWSMDFMSDQLADGRRIRVLNILDDFSRRCLASEVEALRQIGLGKGANYDNTLVVNGDCVVNNELRYPNEFVRHKILDLLGDLVLPRTRFNRLIRIEDYRRRVLDRLLLAA